MYLSRLLARDLVTTTDRARLLQRSSQTPRIAGGELLPAWRVTHHAGYAAVIGTGRQSFSSDNWRPTERQPASQRGGKR